MFNTFSKSAETEPFLEQQVLSKSMEAAGTEPRTTHLYNLWALTFSMPNLDICDLMLSSKDVREVFLGYKLIFPF